jgi:phthalate 4,5-dioxygenase reductase subunit
MQETPDSPPLALVLKARRVVARDIVEFTFAAQDGAALPAFTPGAHIGVHTPAGVVRKYSLVNLPEDSDRYTVAVRRDGNGRGGSVSLIDGTREGDAVLVEAPQNAFPLAESARRFLFIAGGIGITPILGMVRHLRRRAAEGEANTGFRLVYLTRSPEDTAYREELADPEIAAQVTLHHDGGDPANALDLWPLLEKPQAGTHVYCCGPRGLMDAVRDMAGHWPDTAVHFESFGPGDAAQFEANQAFTIRLARSGGEIEVDADQTALEALTAHGVRVQSSCEAGSCGSCRTPYLSGDVEHRDMVLGEDEKADQIMVCVSRARGGVLELDL